MPKIKVKEGDNLEYAIRRFKKICEKMGILSEIKNRVAFEKPSLARKKKSLMARKRVHRKSRYLSS
ncbi:MAG: 30S ribosomal protein S21 [Bdellovibrionales bacterium]|nr:30S ribosomal protein S21 [Bdellovibrionales bacterium]